MLLLVLSGVSYAEYIIPNRTSFVQVTEIENHNPNPPEITGKTSGKINTLYTYYFFLTDPDNDDLKAIQIEWGGIGSDNSTYICFTCQGSPLPNGSTFEYDHYWAETGNYTIRAKVWDINDNESDWGTLTVTMPCSYTTWIPPFLEVFFYRFQYAFPILRHLIGY